MQVVDHHPGWATLATDACQELRLAGGDLLVDVQHVGSTSVPDLPAKPILDIAAAVPTLQVLPELVARLTEIGYIYRGDGEDSGGHLFVRESSPEVRTIHVHAVQHEGSQWRNYLLFRNLLRQDVDLRKQYAELKAELASKFQDDRKTYTASKHNFIRRILEKREAQPSVPGDA